MRFSTFYFTPAAFPFLETAWWSSTGRCYCPWFATSVGCFSAHNVASSLAPQIPCWRGIDFAIERSDPWHLISNVRLPRGRRVFHGNPYQLSDYVLPQFSEALFSHGLRLVSCPAEFPHTGETPTKTVKKTAARAKDYLAIRLTYHLWLTPSVVVYPPFATTLDNFYFDGRGPNTARNFPHGPSYQLTRLL